MSKPSENSSISQERLITRNELAELCKVSTRTIDNWVAEKSIPVFHGPRGRCVRFLWSEVLLSLRSGNQNTSK